MADIFINPGLNQLQPAVNAAAANGTRIIMENGEYTFSGNNAAVFDSSVAGKIFSNLTIMSKNPKGAILNVNGVGFDAFYGGNAVGVKFSDMVWKGTPGQRFLRDHADSSYIGWTFEQIDLDGCAKIPWQLYLNPGASISITDVVTRANFQAQRVIDLFGTPAELDLKISDIDARLHTTGSMEEAIRLRDWRDARLRNIETKDTFVHGIHIECFDPLLGIKRIYGSHIHVDGTGSVGIHVGNTAIVSTATDVWFTDVHIENSAAYGFEFENQVTNSGLVNFRIENVQLIGVPLAEDTENILVQNGVIDGVGTDIGQGVALVNARQHRVLNNVVANTVYGIRMGSTGGFTLHNERNQIKDNIFYNVDYGYRIYTNAISSPAGILSNMIGPNIMVRPRVNYARVDDNAGSTQAQVMANPTLADQFDKDDVIVDDVRDLKFIDPSHSNFATYKGTYSPTIPETYRAGFYFTHPHIDHTQRPRTASKAA